MAIKGINWGLVVVLMTFPKTLKGDIIILNY